MTVFALQGRLRRIGIVRVSCRVTAAIVVATVCAWSSQADALSLTVNTDVDQSNYAGPSLPCDIIGPTLTPNLPPLCSLRAAIEITNAVPGVNIIDILVPTISITSPLPSITAQMMIGTGATFTPVIDGSAVGVKSDGLVFVASNNKVQSLSVVGFKGAGIHFVRDGNRVTGSLLGVDPSGTVNPNVIGIAINGSNNRIDGHNVISGNAVAGVAVCGSGPCSPATVAGTGTVTGAQPKNNIIIGNYIGTDAAGLAAVANSQVGVYLEDAVLTTIGGGAVTERNIISGNGAAGIEINGGAQNRVTGNYVGLSLNGQPLGNNGPGVILQNASTNYVGGATAIGAPPGGSTTTVSAAACGDPVPASGLPPGNVISANLGPGVSIVGKAATKNHIEGNFIGSDPQGLNAIGNYDGISVQSAPFNYLGGFVAGSGNLISGNSVGGIRVQGRDASDNSIQCAWIGVDISGQRSLGNAEIGIYVTDAERTMIGGRNPAARNVISANGAKQPSSGIYLDGIASQTHVEGNFIGLDAHGIGVMGNSGNGISLVGVSDNVIGGVNDKTGTGRNVISANGLSGILVLHPTAQRNRIIGNHIGTDVAGRALVIPLAPPGLKNQNAGIYLDHATYTQIGESSAQTRNVISGNDLDGIVISGQDAAWNSITGNFIGTDSTGKVASGNGNSGIAILDAPDNTIGGATKTTGSGSGNLISGNRGTNQTGAISLSGAHARNNHIWGNLIGTADDGKTPLPNHYDGIFVTDNASDSEIGADQDDYANVIAFNGRAGVLIDKGNGGKNSTGNAILSNRIFNNGALGIDLGGDGVTQNQPSAAGPNNWQNYPVIRFNATRQHAADKIVGIVHSVPNRDVTVQVYENAVGDVSGYGQGETVYARLNGVKVDKNGFGTIILSAWPADKVLSATVTDGDGNTSEFAKLPCQSNPRQSNPIDPPPVMRLTATWRDLSGKDLIATAAGSAASAKPVLPLKYPDPSARLVLHIEVTRLAPALPAGAPPDDITKTFVTVTVRDVLSTRPEQGQVYAEQQPLDANGHADLVIDPGSVLKVLSADVNASFFEAEAHVCYRGRSASRASDNYLHLMREQVVVFLPGVLGSRIELASPLATVPFFQPTFEGFPNLGTLCDVNMPGCFLTQQLASDDHGVPLQTPELLRLLQCFTPLSKNNDCSTAGPLGVKVYDVQAPFGQTLTQHFPTHLSINTTNPNAAPGKYPYDAQYYYLQPWPYDWRIDLRNHVDSLLTSPGSPAPSGGVLVGEPLTAPYREPPSLQTIRAAYATKSDFLDDKVALAGHSTGGVIMRLALSGPKSAAFEPLVERAFFINTPMLGAPKAYYVFLTGDMVPKLIAKETMQSLAPNMPVLYALAPTERYTDANSKPPNAVAIYTLNGQPEEPVRQLGTPAASFMDPMIELYTGQGTSNWNGPLSDAADQMQQSISGVRPVIGWNNTLVFWTQQEELVKGKKRVMAKTPGPVVVSGIGTATPQPTIGDETVPMESELGDAPQYVWRKHGAMSPFIPHQHAANDPKLWSQIIDSLEVPYEASFRGYSPFTAFANSGICPNAELFGETEMETHATTDLKYTPILSATTPKPKRSQGFDGAYCAGTLVSQLKDTGFWCDGDVVIGEAKGGYSGQQLDDVMGLGYKVRQGTIEWGRRAAVATLASGNAALPQRTAAQAFLDALEVGVRTRVEVFHAECSAIASTTATQTEVYHTARYPF